MLVALLISYCRELRVSISAGFEFFSQKGELSTHKEACTEDVGPL